MDRTSILKRRQTRRLLGRQRGVTLLEALAALFIGALMIVGVTMMINTSLNDTRDQEVAQYQRQIATAVNDAIKLNYATLLTSIPVGGATTAWSVVDLVNNNYIPANFGTTKNAFQQSVCLLFQQPVKGEIDALLVSTGGTAIPRAELGYIAANAGVGGGLIDTQTPISAVGAYGGWNAPASLWDMAPCTLTAGHLANQLFMMGPGNQSTDFLYRNAVPGHPELNAMNVPIGLNIIPTGAGTPCTSLSDTSVPFAVDPTNHLLTCLQLPGSQPHWSQGSWGEPVATVSDLQKLSAVDGLIPGQTRVTMDTQLPYTWTGTKWVPSAVDNNGALNLPKVVVKDTACGLDINGAVQSAAVQLGVTSSGEVLSCQNGQWTSTAVIERGYADKNCMTIYGADPSGPTPIDYSCESLTLDNKWDATTRTMNNYVYLPVTLARDGVINVTTFAHMNYAECNVTNRLGQLTQYLDIMDSTDTTIYEHSEMQTPNIENASGGVSVTLNKALPQGSYSIRVTTNWGIFTGDGTDGKTWYSNYCPYGVGNGIVTNTPLVMGWNISAVN